MRREKFLLFIKTDLKRRNEKVQEVWQSLQPKRKIISKEKMDEFFQRLLKDENKRYVSFIILCDQKCLNCGNGQERCLFENDGNEEIERSRNDC